MKTTTTYRRPARSRIRCGWSAALILAAAPVLAGNLAGNLAEDPAGRTGTPAESDTVICIDRVQVTAIKQGMTLRTQPVASTVVGQQAIERSRIDALQRLSLRIPNLHLPEYGSRMTSSIYVRGLGTRIDQPVVGLNVDNVPVMQKNNFDIELADIDRIEVLRGPQSTLYGRNTMGGVMNIYTLSPLQFQGFRFGAEYATGNSFRVRASLYERPGEHFGWTVSGFYRQTDGLFENRTTGRRCDNEQSGGGRLRLQWRSDRGWSADNTLNFSILDQGGYAYAYVGPDIVRDSRTVARSGEIAYNDPCGYRRTTLSNGLTLRRDTERFAFSSITSYQYSDDRMRLDQDFLPLSYFTLQQALREHCVTEEAVFRSTDRTGYGWLFGAFGFYRHGTMSAPVEFKQTGVDELIFAHANAWLGDEIRFSKCSDQLLLASDFRMPSFGGALYHESRWQAGRWSFTAGLRIDVEQTRLNYRSRSDLDFLIAAGGAEPVQRTASIDERNSLRRTYVEWLPKATVLYAFDGQRNLYCSIAKGYKAGGYNTQLFSDILQEKLKWAMVSGGGAPEQESLSYRPEQSWNYEAGGHFVCMEGAVRGDFALFYIDCRNQQLTVFPEGSSTGRMMTNAGKSRSWGVEATVQCSPWRNLELNAAYGYTDARFVDYDNGRQRFDGNFVPYAPQHTLSVEAVQRIPTGWTWLGDLVLQAGLRGTGAIRWNEENSLTQPFYTLFDASIRLEHPRYTLALWGRNLGDRLYDVFYFKSIGHEFVQRGRPRTMGVTLSLKL